MRWKLKIHDKLNCFENTKPSLKVRFNLYKIEDETNF